MLEELLEYNQGFVEKKEYEKYSSGKFPKKKMAIVSCMDTRLTELLPAALGIKNGDVKIIKCAGAVISSPFGSVMRSLIIAIYELDVQEILVIGHHDCGMKSLDSKEIEKKMKDRQIPDDVFRMISYCGVDFHKWLSGFDSVEESVRSTVRFIADHPLIPKDVAVNGLIMDPGTGKMERV